MKVLVAMDSYKGSLSSWEAGSAAAAGIKKADAHAGIQIFPLADGGEGTAKTLTRGLQGEMVEVTVTGPLGLPVKASYGIVKERRLAVLEIAEAAGLTLVPEEKRNPLHTTTYGVGEMIRDALRRGSRHFIVGLGGSATNDGGMGMLKALGVRFLDESGRETDGYGNGRSLHNIKKIDRSGMPEELNDCDFRIACDVDNPLYGENGAACIFGPQKGADGEAVRLLDAGLRSFAIAAGQSTGKDNAMLPGAGAAGGLGYAFFTFLNGRPEKGVDLVMDVLSLEERIKEADYIVTGEGRTDAQTSMGKAPAGIARLAKKYGKKVIVLSGSVSADAGLCNSEGIDAVFSILREPISVEEAMDKRTAAENLEWTAEQVFRLVGTPFPAGGN